MKLCFTNLKKDFSTNELQVFLFVPVMLLKKGYTSYFNGFSYVKVISVENDVFLEFGKYARNQLNRIIIVCDKNDTSYFDIVSSHISSLVYFIDFEKFAAIPVEDFLEGNIYHKLRTEGKSNSNAV